MQNERQSEGTHKTETRSCAPHAPGGPAPPSRPGLRGGARQTLRMLAPLSLPRDQHTHSGTRTTDHNNTQLTPEQADREAAKTTANQHNKPTIEVGR